VDAYKNFAYSTVATAPSPAASGTSLVLAAGDGAKFPTPPYNVVIWPTGANPLTTNAEIARATALATDTLTLTRAQEATSARSVLVGDQIAAVITKKWLDDLLAGWASVFQGAATSPASLSASGMLGIGALFTPSTSRAFVSISGSSSTSSAGNNNSLQIRYGTGSAPANGSAVTGAAAGPIQRVSAADYSAVSISAIITGLTPGVQIWIDLAFSRAAGSNSFSNIAVAAHDL